MNKIIKAFVIFLPIFCLMCSCNNAITSEGKETDDNLFINVGSIDLSENDMLGGYEDSRIPDDKTAARVAEAYFYSICSSYSSVEKHKPFNVAYDTTKKIWEVSGKPLGQGDDMVIYLDQITGEVLMIGFYAD